MRVVVFGAGGRLGRHLVENLLALGHQVRAFVHIRNELPRHDCLEIRKGDVHVATEVAGAISGADVVIASLGSMGAPVADVASSGTTHIVPAMKACNISRIVSITGSAAYDEGEANAPHPYLRMRHEAMKVGAPDRLADGEKHIGILRRSDLEWTVVRAPLMTQDANTAYMLSADPPPPWITLSYRAVATAMIDLMATRDWLFKAPFIS